MMSVVKANKTFKIQFALQNLPKNFKNPNNELYCNSWSCTVSFLLKVIEIRPNNKKRLLANLNY